MKTEPATPEVTPARAAWLVWIIPVIALLVGGYLLVREFSGRGPSLTVQFVDGAGLEAGQTRLLCRGVTVGRVEAVHLGEDLQSVEVVARLDASARELARAGTRIWIARPNISLSGISGLDTIVRGVHLEIEPGDGPETRRFVGLERPPNELELNRNRHYTLHTAHRGSVNEGVPVIFRGMVIGRVDSVALAPDATEVLVEVVVDFRYHTLVREGTVFWDAGGVNMKVGLLGAKIRTGSLESILAGAIALAVPPDSADAPIAASGSHFVLQPEVKNDWLEWKTPVALPLIEGESALPAAVEE